MRKIISNNFQMLKYIIKFCPSQLLVIVCVALIKSLLSILSVLSLKYVIDSITIYKDFAKILKIILLFLVLNILLLTICTWLEQRIVPVNNEKISGKLQLLLFEKAASLDLECYENTAYYNKLSIAREQAEMRMVGVLDTFSTAISSIFSITAFITLITLFEPIIIIISITSVILSFGINTIIIKFKHKFYQKIAPLDRKMSYVQRVSSQPEYAMELRLYNQFPQLLKKKFEIKLKEKIMLLDDYSKKIIKLMITQNTGSQVLNTSTILYLIYKTFIGTITMGNFVALANSSQQLTQQIFALIKVIPEIYEHGIYIENFLEFISYEPTIQNSPNALGTPNNGNLEFKNVYFKYSNTDKYALKNINLKIKYGEKVAIVGRNGAGKSTMVKLLNRLYNPTEGEIYLNDVSYKNYDINLLRNFFGTLVQDFQIFAVSMAENILMHEVSKSDDEKRVKDSLKFASLDKKVEGLEKGIFSELTKEFCEDGVICSGGEYQKIAIARTFQRNSKILILDEPSSSLDPVSEKELFDKMVELAAGKTVIIVSHRLSNITDADKIIYIDDGEIKENGSHIELIKKNGLYAKMYKIQAERYKNIFENGEF